MEILAIVTAIVSLLATAYIGFRQVAIQERMLILEKERDEAAKAASQRAALTCALMRVPGTRQMRTVLRIANDGPCEARDVKVTIDGAPLAEHPCILDRVDIPVIGPASYFDVLMVFTMGNPHPPFEVTISWEDDNGIKNPPIQEHCELVSTEQRRFYVNSRRGIVDPEI